MSLLLILSTVIDLEDWILTRALAIECSLGTLIPGSEEDERESVAVAIMTGLLTLHLPSEFRSDVVAGSLTQMLRSLPNLHDGDVTHRDSRAYPLSRLQKVQQKPSKFPSQASSSPSPLMLIT